MRGKHIKQIPQGRIWKGVKPERIDQNGIDLLFILVDVESDWSLHNMLGNSETYRKLDIYLAWRKRKESYR